MTFYIALTLIFLAVTVLVLSGLWRGEGTEAGASDLAVYRAQLAEVERDAGRGVLDPDEAARLRIEISRRLLAADKRANASGTTLRKGQRGLGAALMLLVLAGSAALYWTLGAPGYGDMALQDRIAAAAETRATRPSQAEIVAQMPARTPLQTDADYIKLVERLRQAVITRPDDLRGLALLARNEAILGNYSAAAEAQGRVITLKGAAAGATDYVTLGDALILGAGGYVSPEAEAALKEALARDPDNGTAQYYIGLMLAQTGRPDRAFHIWDRLLRRARGDEPWVRPIRNQIGDAAWFAGVQYELPEAPALPGPDADAVAGAAEMSAEDRQEMIRGMVARLSDRLATEGGSPAEWARLIGALGVLGDFEQANAIWQEAQTRFAGKEDALQQIDAAARNAGLTK